MTSQDGEFWELDFWDCENWGQREITTYDHRSFWKLVIYCKSHAVLTNLNDYLEIYSIHDHSTSSARQRGPLVVASSPHIGLTKDSSSVRLMLKVYLHDLQTTQYGLVRRLVFVGVLEVVLPQTVPIPGWGLLTARWSCWAWSLCHPAYPGCLSPSSLPCSLVASCLCCSEALKSSNHRSQSQSNLSNFVFLVNRD